MKNLVPMDDFGIFADSNATAKVNSLFVAQAFEKEHKNVLRDIEKLIAPDSGLSAEFNRLNFEPITYHDARNRKQKAYALTRDGFTMLVMGYTGRKALQFKELYIERFNQMEAFIKTLVSARKDFPQLTAAIHLAHDDPQPYHYSNECNLLCGLVTGMTVKQFRAAHGIPKGQSIRPYLSADQIKMLDTLQKIDIGLLVAVPDYQQRKEYLERCRDKAQARDRLTTATQEPRAGA